MSELVRPIDQFGTVIKVGDHITYPVRSGSWMSMKRARVLDIEYYTTYYNKNPKAKLICEIPSDKSTWDDEERTWNDEKIIKKVTIWRWDRSTNLEGESLKCSKNIFEDHTN